MLSQRIQIIFPAALRYFVGVVFLISGISKLYSPQDAATFTSEFLGVSTSLSVAVIISLSIAECVLGSFLVSGKNLKAVSLLSSIFFLLSFVVGALYGDEGTTCGCFGNLTNSKIDVYFMVRNAMLMAFSISLLRNSVKDQLQDIE